MKKQKSEYLSIFYAEKDVYTYRGKLKELHKINPKDTFELFYILEDMLLQPIGTTRDNYLICRVYEKVSA